MNDPQILALIDRASRDAEVCWAEMRTDERAGKTSAAYRAAAILRALRRAGLIAEAKPCA